MKLRNDQIATILQDHGNDYKIIGTQIWGDKMYSGRPTGIWPEDFTDLTGMTLSELKSWLGY